MKCSTKKSLKKKKHLNGCGPDAYIADL